MLPHHLIQQIMIPIGLTYRLFVVPYGRSLISLLRVDILLKAEDYFGYFDIDFGALVAVVVDVAVGVGGSCTYYENCYYGYYLCWGVTTIIIFAKMENESRKKVDILLTVVIAYGLIYQHYYFFS